MMERLIAIGDIHGCSLALDALIEAIRPSASDVIVTLGDYIDRGPDSRGVLDRLLALERRCCLIPLLGNHDEALLETLADRSRRAWYSMGALATLMSYGLGLDPSLIPPDHIAFLRRCLDYYETDSHLFVHASYAPNLPMAEQPGLYLRWASLRDEVPGPHYSGKTVVSGHTSQKSGEILDLGYLKCIDTCCYGGGWLTALEVGSGRVWQADAGGRLREELSRSSGFRLDYKGPVE
ncbi:MAG: serine/threonine protein phosphatase [Isosphaeraceae bacterium]|nr:serine/threonine protein phosphatase [Isosphaeraceae bacterium]